jgi:hypothetical protein
VSAGCVSPDLVQFPGRDVEDEPADRVGVREERAGLDPGDTLAHILAGVGERLGGPGRLDPGLVLDGPLDASSVKVSMPQSV